MTNLVLYVEDDDLSREIMELAFTDIAGTTLLIFPNSEHFAQRLADLPQKPSLVLLDIHVKPLTGFEMLKHLRSQPESAGIPVVALTASVMSQEVAQLRQAGFDGAIAKPIILETFADSVHQAIRGEPIWAI